MSACERVQRVQRGTHLLGLAAQAFAWCAVFVLSVLIVASRKHYTVDVLIAWYVVPLVFYAMLRRWTTKRPVNEEPWPHRSLAEDNALQLEEIVVHGSVAAPEVTCIPTSHLAQLLVRVVVHGSMAAPEMVRLHFTRLARLLVMIWS